MNISPRYLLIVLCLFISFDLGLCNQAKAVSRAEVQSCSGCSLNGLPEVKAFIFKDVPKYEGVVFKHIQGAPPELVLFNDKYEETERIPLRGMSRDECNELLLEKGFNLKDEPSGKKEL